MPDAQDAKTLRIAAACLLAAAMLAVLPAAVRGKLRDAVRGVMAPGQQLVSGVLSSGMSRWQGFVSEQLAGQDQEIQDLRRRLAQAELKHRRAALAASHSRQELEATRKNGRSPFAVTESPRLLQSRAVRANVLGREILSKLKADRILSRGNADGISADQWVLDGDLSVVEAGLNHGLTSGLPVFAGRTIVGRIVQAGRWTSSLQPITATGFRSRAVLATSLNDEPDVDVNDESEGQPLRFSFGPEGLLEGTGEANRCRLTQIPASEHVEPGQSVYSPPGHPVDAPMLFGRVVSAELSAGALHWEIVVEPAARVSELKRVEVVIPEVAPRANSTTFIRGSAGGIYSEEPKSAGLVSSHQPQGASPGSRDKPGLAPNGTHFVVFASEPYALASGSVQRRNDALPEASAYGSV